MKHKNLIIRIFLDILGLTFFSFCVLLVIFIFTRLLGGSPFELTELRDNQEFVSLIGLYKPSFSQFFIFIRNLFTMNWGTTFDESGVSTEVVLNTPLLLSLKMILISFSLMLLLGIFAGYLLEKYKERKITKYFSAIVQIIWVIPLFGIGILLRYLFPTSNNLVLPIFCMNFTVFYIITDLSHLIISNVKNSNDMPFFFGRLGFYNTLVLSSAIIIEKIFDINGFGSLILRSIQSHDYFVIISCLFILLISFVILFILLNSFYLILKKVLKKKYPQKENISGFSNIPPMDKNPVQINESKDDRPTNKELIIKFIKNNSVSIISVILVLLSIIFAVFSPWISIYDFEFISAIWKCPPPPWETLDKSSLVHPLGQNKYGLDVFGRCLYGTRTALSIGIIPILLSIPLGVFIGVISAIKGKWMKQIFDYVIGILFFISGTVFLILFFEIVINEELYFIMIFLLTSTALIAKLTIEAVENELRMQSLDPLLSDGRKNIKFLKAIFLKKNSLLIPIIFVSISFVMFFYEVLSYTGSYTGFGDPRLVDLGIDIAISESILQVAPWASLWPSFWLLFIILGYSLVGIGFKKKI